MSYIFST